MNNILQFKYLKCIHNYTEINLQLYCVNIQDFKYYMSPNIIVNAAQYEIRIFIDKYIRKNANPWCIIQNNSRNIYANYNLSYEAAWYWKLYSDIPKVFAFQYKKLVGLKCKRITDTIFNTDDKKYWFTTQNIQCKGIPFYKELDNDPLHRKALFEFYEHTNTYKQISNSFLKINHKTYEWDINGKLLNK